MMHPANVILAIVMPSVGAVVMKGIAYAPVPLKSPGFIPGDDFTEPNCEPFWGASGRSDLAIMRELGANAVRLYGNDPRFQKAPFLNEANQLGLQVILGFSDYPYNQMVLSCKETGFDCYEQVKHQYLLMLANGLLQHDRTYHPALGTLNLVNEPDLKFGIETPANWVKAIISAFDGVLDAERAFAVEQPHLRVTVTFSASVCSACANTGPGVGQMLELRTAMQNPAAYGYSPNNDLMEAYSQRFVNSFNTQADVLFVRTIFMPQYQDAFGSVPFFIGEYHSFDVAQGNDLTEIVKLAEDTSNPLEGLSFFEFQVRSDKGGTETLFGIFELGNERQGEVIMGDSGLKYPVWCLAENFDNIDRTTPIHESLAAAFGGPGLQPSRLCAPPSTHLRNKSLLMV